MVKQYLAASADASAPDIAATALFAPSLMAFRIGQASMVAPFDAMRAHYAGAVASGLVPRSLLASARLERALDAAEKLSLGVLARRR